MLKIVNNLLCKSPMCTVYQVKNIRHVTRKTQQVNLKYEVIDDEMLNSLRNN